MAGHPGQRRSEYPGAGADPNRTGTEGAEPSADFTLTLEKKDKAKANRWDSLTPDERGFVKLRDGDVYRIRIENNAPYMLAVKVTVDGLNVLSVVSDPTTFPVLPELVILGGKDGGKDGGKNTRIDGDTKKPYPSVQIIHGWVKTPTTQAEFEVGAYAVSVAGLKRATSEVGVVSAVAFGTYDGEKPPKEMGTLIGPPMRIKEGKLLPPNGKLIDPPYTCPVPGFMRALRYRRNDE